MSIINTTLYYTTDELLEILKKDNIQVDNKLIERARTDDDKAFCSIGEKYYSNKDQLKAMIWFLKSAYFNNSSAQYYIGRIFENGRDSPENIRQALEWYQRSSDQSNRLAITRIIKLRWKGYYLDSNKKAFINLERKSEELKRSYLDKIEDLEHRYQASLKVLDYENLSFEYEKRIGSSLMPIQEIDETVQTENEIDDAKIQKKMEILERKNQLLEDSIKILERENLLNQEAFEKEKRKVEDSLELMKAEYKRLIQQIVEKEKGMSSTIETMQEEYKKNLTEIRDKNKKLEDALLHVQALVIDKQAFDERLIALESIFSRFTSSCFTARFDNTSQGATTAEQSSNHDINKIRIVVEYNEK